MFDISDVCPEKAAFRIIAALLFFRMFGISDVCHCKAGFRIIVALFGFSDV